MRDLKITSTGELVLDATTGRETLVSGDDYIAQAMLFRLKTYKGDCLVTPGLGTRLEDFIGQPADDDVLDNIRSMVITEVSSISGAAISDVIVAEITEGHIFIGIEFYSVEDILTKTFLEFDLDLVTGEVAQR